MNPSDCTIFKSAMTPMKLSFQGEKVNQNGKNSSCNYHFIYKNGDDLRQDQLIIQLFRLLDSLLKAVNLDFELTTYRL